MKAPRIGVAEDLDALLGRSHARRDGYSSRANTLATFARASWSSDCTSSNLRPFGVVVSGDAGLHAAETARCQDHDLQDPRLHHRVTDTLDGNTAYVRQKAPLNFLSSAMGGGAIAGSLILARLGGGGRKGPALLGLATAWSLFLAAFALSERIPTALALIAVVGLTSSTFMSLSMSLVQLAVTPEMRGRVMSVIMMSFGLMPVGAVPISFVADYVGIAAALIISSVALLFVTVLVAVSIPEIRRIDRGVGPTGRTVPMSPEEID